MGIIKVDVLQAWWETWGQRIEKMDTKTLKGVYSMTKFSANTKKKLQKMMKNELDKRGGL